MTAVLVSIAAAMMAITWPSVSSTLSKFVRSALIS